MAFITLLWQIITLAVMNILEKTLNAADWIMFTIEEYEAYDNIVEFLSFCVGNFYFWQTVATIGFCDYLHRLAAKFPPPIIPIDVRPSMEESLDEKEKSIKDAATKNDSLDKETARLRAEIDRLQKEVDFISKDRYDLVREKCILQNKLGDFNSWPEFRVEYDELATEYEAMKRQRAREQISHDQILHVAKEAKSQLAAAKRAEVMSKTAHNEELKLVKQERDDVREKYENLLKTTTATATAATAAITAGNKPREIALEKENIRLTLALRSQTVLLAKKASEFERMQSLVKSRSEHAASQLKSATSTIRSLEEYRAKADKRIVELEEAVKEANEKAEEMEGMYMAVAFMDKTEDEAEDEEEKEEKGENEEEDGNGGEDRPPTPWLLKQMVAMRKKEWSEVGATGGGPDADGSGSEEGDEDGDGEEEESNEDEENEDDDREGKIHEENEDLFQDMLGRP